MAACASEPIASAPAAPAASDTPAATQKPTEAPAKDEPVKATLTIAIWDNLVNDLYQSLDIQSRFQNIYPGVDIEVEKIKNDSEYWDAMKIRASANELPDLMFNKTFTLAQFKDYLVDLGGTEAAKSNDLASAYSIGGKVLGIPQTMTTEYVFYWQDMFDEAGVAVPTTWPAFIAAAEKLQAYFEPSNPDFMAIALGAKDEWPTYPFVEFMPALQNGDGFNWDSMAKLDEPFAEGANMNTTYKKIYDLFSLPVFGSDPNGIGHDQAVSLFAQKRAAIIVSGSWCLDTIQQGTDDVSTLKTFYLPVRDTESDPFRIIAQGDSFLGVTTHSQNQQIAIDFVEFYFSDAWYKDYINSIPDDGTVPAFAKAKTPALQIADETEPKDKILVMYDGGGDGFQSLVNETKFDYKKLGAEMFVDGFDLQKRFDDLNASWKTARAKLGI
jgi:raffinose/stachyose/melibiose transport system substrate-binding protein